MWFFENITDEISTSIGEMFAHEGMCFRFSYFLKFIKDSNGNIKLPLEIPVNYSYNDMALPLSIKKKQSNDIDECSPMNSLVIKNNLLPLFNKDYNELTIPICKTFNYYYYENLKELQKELYKKYPDNIIWKYIDFGSYFLEILEWVKSLSYYPLLNEKWADIFMWHYISDFNNTDGTNDVVKWYNKNSCDKIPNIEYNGRIYNQYRCFFNFKTIALYQHEIMWIYVTYMKENPDDVNAIGLEPILKKIILENV